MFNKLFSISMLIFDATILSQNLVNIEVLRDASELLLKVKVELDIHELY
jgi:hypothetical protein